MYKRQFDGSVVPEPTAEPGRGGIMGRLTAGSLARVLGALPLRADDVFFDVGVGTGAVLGAVHLLAPTVRLAGVEADEGLLAAARRNLAALNTVAALARAGAGHGAPRRRDGGLLLLAGAQGRRAQGRRGGGGAGGVPGHADAAPRRGGAPVSYTHLTLPTIYSV